MVASSDHQTDLDPRQGNVFSSSQAALEKIKPPTSSGKQEDWEIFKDKFTTMIVDEIAMSCSYKDPWLNNSLEGEAFDLIKGIRATAENFYLSWKTLCKEYDNINRRICAIYSIVYLL